MKSKVFMSMFTLFFGFVCFYLGCVSEETGTLTINLTDDPAQYCEVHVTFSEISVHKAEVDNQDDEEVEEQPLGNEPNESNEFNDYEADSDIEDNNDDEKGGNWIIIKGEEEEQGYNLLELEDAFVLLAEADLEPGVYTQIRLKIVEEEDESANPKTYIKLTCDGEGDDACDCDGEKIPLEVPSGAQSGLKLIRPFKIVASEKTTLYLDFDANKSVVQANNEQYKLNPTIKILTEFPHSQGIKGHVYNADDSTPEVPALVDEATVTAYQDGKEIKSHITDEDGYFELSLPAGTYSLEVGADDFKPYVEDTINVESKVWVEKEIALDLL